MKGDDGLRTSNHLEERLLDEYRKLTEDGQRSIRRILRATLKYQSGKPAPTPPNRRGMSDAESMQQWKREAGMRARGGA